MTKSGLTPLGHKIRMMQGLPVCTPCSVELMFFCFIPVNKNSMKYLEGNSS